MMGLGEHDVVPLAQVEQAVPSLTIWVQRPRQRERAQRTLEWKRHTGTPRCPGKEPDVERRIVSHQMGPVDPPAQLGESIPRRWRVAHVASGDAVDVRGAHSGQPPPSA